MQISYVFQKPKLNDPFQLHNFFYQDIIKQGGLLIYIKAHLTSILLANHILPKDIPAISSESNLRKEK